MIEKGCSSVDAVSNRGRMLRDRRGPFILREDRRVMLSIDKGCKEHSADANQDSGVPH